jgi:hypothetical protein
VHRVRTVVAQDPATGAETITLTYDGFGNRSRFTSQAAGGDAARNQDGFFFYDAQDRVILASALDATGTVGSATVTRRYDLAGNLSGKTIGGSQVDSFTYDAMNRVLSSTINGVTHASGLCGSTVLACDHGR